LTAQPKPRAEAPHQFLWSPNTDPTVPLADVPVEPAPTSNNPKAASLLSGDDTGQTAHEHDEQDR
jgi:hypothetical protein